MGSSRSARYCAAMSQENVEIMRRSMDAFNRRDRTAWLELRGEPHEVKPLPDWPEQETQGGEAAWDLYVGVADAVAIEFEADLVDAGPDKVLAHQRNTGRGRTSGAEVELDYWIVITFRDGVIVRDEWFSNRPEALEAAGLAE